MSLSEGLYFQLLDHELKDLLDAHPELKVVLRKLDDESAPHTYSQFLHHLMEKALHILEPGQRIPLVNRIIQLISALDGLDFFERNQLLSTDKPLITQISKQNRDIPSPVTPINTSSLLTGQGGDPTLEHELRAEMKSADRVDMLVSFIKWSGLRLLMPALEDLEERGVPVRILSTSYMGASDPPALEWLAKRTNTQIRLSYDVGGTRLHAKAYHFIRKSGFSTAYIGSANISHAAMTNGLEWTVKVTAQDMVHILHRFEAEFATYWESREFESYDEREFQRFRLAIQGVRSPSTQQPRFFADLVPRPFQQRILEALDAARQQGFTKNLVVAATGTGKTVIAGFDYQKQVLQAGKQPRLLFVAHRKEILQQALDCFRTVLKDYNFGELLVDGQKPHHWNHVFASVQSLTNEQPWRRFGSDYFSYVIVDEAHHGTAASYRPIFQSLTPQILLGLTATPERMDGSSILPDFDHRMAAEIRLPEALYEKLLCPFHYFGVTDSIDLSADRFWRNGRYATDELEKVLTGDDLRAKQRVDLILSSLEKYQPDLDHVRGIGFCAGVTHAHYMADHFQSAGIPSAVLLGSTSSQERAELLQSFKDKKLTFLFTVDVLSEGVDIPEINLVLFLRPTDSLTVFLQQLGRGLRHAPGKDCLTVLDFVGMTHRNYRIDQRFGALLLRQRFRLDREVEEDFPNLPPGCNIYLERVARQRVLAKITQVLAKLDQFIPETIRTWNQEHQVPLTFGNFITTTGLPPVVVLKQRTWSEWKAISNQSLKPTDPNLSQLKISLTRIALRSDPEVLRAMVEDPGRDHESDLSDSSHTSDALSTAVHYLRWGKKAGDLGFDQVADANAAWYANPSIRADAKEIVDWKLNQTQVLAQDIPLPFPCFLKLHGFYGSAEIKAALGLATFERSGPAGQGVLHAEDIKCYIHLITFQKDAKQFSPTTRYQDYPLSPTRLHWESQSTTSQGSQTGQNYLEFKERGYTILFFARLTKQIDGVTAPFMYLGPAKELLSAEGNRPIRMVWELEYPIPAMILEEAMPVG